MKYETRKEKAETIEVTELEDRLDSLADLYRNATDIKLRYEISVKTMYLIASSVGANNTLAAKLYTRYEDRKNIEYPQSLIVGVGEKE